MFDRMMNEMMSNFFSGTNGTVAAVNIIEAPDHYRIEMAAPGLKKDDFELKMDNGVLTISVNKEWKLEEGHEFRRREFAYYNFERSFMLPETVDADKIKATYKNGILTVTLPKKEEAKEKPPRKIEIK
ncbi:MAG: Hsp20/alpha crystallin family protein [Bacteroidetes bacterium]|nr:MAG: Hsp20/alpha crystallin family protein [Bacteroidota bacterium]